MSPLEAGSGRVVRMVALRSFPGWRDVESRDLALMASATRPRRYATGESLNDAAHPVTAVYFIVSGKVRVTLDGVPTGEFGEHSAVGGLAAFSGLERGYAIDALEDTVTLEISVPDMEEIFEDRFPILLAVLRSMAGMVIELRKQLPRAGFSDEFTVGPVCPARPLDLVERIFYLGNNLALAGRIDSVAVMARTAREIRRAPGDVLWEIGERGDRMVTLVCGSVRCTTANGLEWRMGAGDLIGGLGSLAQVPRWYRAEVIDGVVGLALPSDVSVDVWEDHPDLAYKMLSIFAGNLLALQRRVSETRPPSPS